jgi:nucleotide-binding universal stress UspA family protein
LFRHAMIAVDLDSEGPLLDCAPDLRTWGVTRVTLVHLIKVGYMQGPRLHDDEWYRQSMATKAEPLRAQGLTVDVDVATAGDVGAALASKAGDLGVDVVVVGNRSQTVLERVFLGSVARKVLRRAAMPVLVQWIDPPAAGAGRCALHCNDTLRHVLLATDLTAASQPVHEVGIALAAQGAWVDLIHVSDTAVAERFVDWPTMARAVLGQLHQQIMAAGGSGEIVLAEGEPHDQVLIAAADRDVSLVVVGKVGGLGPAAHSLGRTARALSKRAGRPVLMVPNR